MPLYCPSYPMIAYYCSLYLKNGSIFVDYEAFNPSPLPTLCVENFNSDTIVVLQEFYADFVAIDPYHFTFHVPSHYIYMLPAVVDPSTVQRFCDRVVEGLAAVFLALKRRPVIRYQRTSDIAKRIAQEATVSSSPLF